MSLPEYYVHKVAVLLGGHSISAMGTWCTITIMPVSNCRRENETRLLRPKRSILSLYLYQCLSEVERYEVVSPQPIGQGPHVLGMVFEYDGGGVGLGKY